MRSDPDTSRRLAARRQALLLAVVATCFSGVGCASRSDIGDSVAEIHGAC
jgi:hypothetical protein